MQHTISRGDGIIKLHDNAGKNLRREYLRVFWSADYDSDDKEYILREGCTWKDWKPLLKGWSMKRREDILWSPEIGYLQVFRDSGYDFDVKGSTYEVALNWICEKVYTTFFAFNMIHYRFPVLTTFLTLERTWKQPPNLRSGQTFS